MSNKYTTQLIEFIGRSLENTESGRATCITGNFREEGIEIYIEIRKKEDEH